MIRGGSPATIGWHGCAAKTCAANEAADGTVKEMVAKNPKAGRAYIYRWRYAREFSPPPDASDIQKALKLAPDDPEVLLTAAVASEQKPDAAAARAYFEKGRKLDPKNLDLALGLASFGRPSIGPRPSCGKRFRPIPPPPPWPSSWRKT